MKRAYWKQLTVRVCGLVLIAAMSAGLWAQKPRKPQRAQPPKFTGKEFPGVFYDDVPAVLQGERPTVAAVNAAMAAAANNANASSGGKSDSGGSDGWAKLISPPTIEDAVKNSKLRLDQVVASQTKFTGGYVEARREFSLLALMFAIIEQYPGDVRWKKSAPIARETLSRMAANSKVSSPQAYKEAKQRVDDLGELLNGTQLSGEASSEVVWPNVIDRVPLMQIAEWAQQQHVNNYSSSKENFSKHKEELQRYAEILAVLGKAAIMNDMPDATDAEYRKLAEMMVEQSSQIVLAVQTDNADLARTAAGQVTQACSKCHDGYR